VGGKLSLDQQKKPATEALGEFFCLQGRGNPGGGELMKNTGSPVLGSFQKCKGKEMKCCLWGSGTLM